MNSIKERLADPNEPIFLTPVGRLVSGDLWVPRTKDYQGNPLKVKTGVNAGQPRSEYSFGLAVLKTDPGLGLLFAKMYVEAKRGFPRLFDTAGNCTHKDFAFKYKDGDSTEPNRNGSRPCDKPEWRGCYVFFFSSSIPTEVIGQDPNQTLTDPNSVRPGYYIRVSGSFKANENQQNPGIYVNHNFVQFAGYGEVINYGPSAEEAFASPVTALPPGASAIPLAPVGVPQMPPISPQGAPVPPAMPSAPATDWLNPSPAAPVPPAASVPPAPPAPVPPAEKKYFFQGAVYTESQLRAGGHTDAHLATYQVAQ